MSGRSKKRRNRRASSGGTGVAPPRETALLRPQLMNEPGKERSVKTTLTQYQGPLPPPAMLAEYSDAVGNGAERVMAMIEGEAEHIRRQERTALNAQITIIKRGQWFALLIAAGSLAAAAFTAQFSVGLATAMVTIGLGTLAVAFLRGFIGGSKGEQQENGKNSK